MSASAALSTPRVSHCQAGRDRRIANVRVLLEMAQRTSGIGGVTVVDWAMLPLHEQIATASQHRLYIGMMGTSMFNAIWMPPSRSVALMVHQHPALSSALGLPTYPSTAMLHAACAGPGVRLHRNLEFLDVAPPWRARGAVPIPASESSGGRSARPHCSEMELGPRPEQANATVRPLRDGRGGDSATRVHRQAARRDGTTCVASSVRAIEL